MPGPVIRIHHNSQEWGRLKRLVINKKDKEMKRTDLSKLSQSNRIPKSFSVPIHPWTKLSVFQKTILNRTLSQAKPDQRGIILIPSSNLPGHRITTLQLARKSIKRLQTTLTLKIGETIQLSADSWKSKWALSKEVYKCSQPLYNLDRLFQVVSDGVLISVN